MPSIYGTYRSRATRNVWLAAEAGIDLTMIPVMQAYRLKDPHAADAPLNTLSPAFLAISPAGAIPVLEDDGFVLTESLAINLYLARKYCGDLGPHDANEDALMQQWAFYGATSIEPAALAIMNTTTSGKVGTAEGDAEIASRSAALDRPLKVVEAHLSAHPHVVGDRFTVADINLAEVLRYAQSSPPLMAAFPAITRWLAACQARPAFQAMWALRMAEPA